jgi:putative NADH-flavin reductase
MRHNVSKERVVVLGSTGTTGRHVVHTAMDRGYEVTAVVRRSGSFSPTEGLREVVWTDFSDRAALASALTGADAVVSTLGGAAKGPTTVCADAIRSTIPAMDRAGVGRLIVVSAHGVAETHDRSLYSLAVWAGAADRMRDKETMESLITASSLDWTIVRPPALHNPQATGRYRVATDLQIRLWSWIGRADLATFLVRETEQCQFVRGLPRIAR